MFLPARVRPACRPYTGLSPRTPAIPPSAPRSAGNEETIDRLHAGGYEGGRDQRGHLESIRLVTPPTEQSSPSSMPAWLPSTAKSKRTFDKSDCLRLSRRPAAEAAVGRDSGAGGRASRRGGERMSWLLFLDESGHDRSTMPYKYAAESRCTPVSCGRSCEGCSVWSWTASGANWMCTERS